jgi:heme-degrading monooxygenase HmoA
MVARVWHGYTTPENAAAYEALLKPELLPGLSSTAGFRGSYLLRRALGSEVEFITIILWSSLDDIRAIAGADYERAVIPEERKRVLSRWDENAAHYDVSSTMASPLSFLGESEGPRR